MVGFSDAEQIEVLRVLAVVLHLGNIKFAEGEREEASVVNRDGAWRLGPSRAFGRVRSCSVVCVHSPGPLAFRRAHVGRPAVASHIAALLAVSPASFMRALTTQGLRTGREAVDRLMSVNLVRTPIPLRLSPRGHATRGRD